eukprot:5671721-Pleurochrysis_carterae.AAC.2
MSASSAHAPAEADAGPRASDVFSQARSQDCQRNADHLVGKAAQFALQWSELQVRVPRDSRPLA